MNKYDREYIRKIGKRWLNIFSIAVIIILIMSISLYMVTHEVRMDCEDIDLSDSCTMHYSNDHRP